MHECRRSDGITTQRRRTRARKKDQEKKVEEKEKIEFHD
jgi:hypothetical protein